MIFGNDPRRDTGSNMSCSLSHTRNPQFLSRHTRPSWSANKWTGCSVYEVDFVSTNQRRSRTFLLKATAPGRPPPTTKARMTTARDGEERGGNSLPLANAATVLAMEKALEPIYTGGRVEVTSTGRILMRSGNSFCLRDPKTGHASGRLLMVLVNCA